MKIMSLIVLVISLTCLVHAGERVTEKSVVTEITNEWNSAVALHEQGERTLNQYASMWLSVCTTNGMANYITGVYYAQHECPKCTQPHLPDWPKTNVVTRGVQKRTEITILRGTNELARTEQYSYPHAKIVDTTIETLTLKTNTVTDVTAVQKPGVPKPEVRSCGRCVP